MICLVETLSKYCSHSKLLSIAVIDDDVSFLAIIEQFLEKISPKTYKISLFDSSNEAFFSINSNPSFDIIISDYEMPALNGLDLFKNLHESGIDIPFILLTGSRNEDLPSKALNAGVKFFLYKDTNIIAVLKQLDQLIKITVAEKNADKEIIEHQNMLSDLIYLITDSNGIQDDSIYSQELIRHILKSFLTISESEFVFLNELTTDEYNEVILSSIFYSSVNRYQSDKNDFKFMDRDNFFFKDLSIYFSNVLIENKPIIENSLALTIFDSNHHKIVIKSFLALPIFFEPNRKIVGILGLVNRLEGYDDKIIFKLNPFTLNLASFMYLNIYIRDLKSKLSIIEE